MTAGIGVACGYMISISTHVQMRMMGTVIGGVVNGGNLLQVGEFTDERTRSIHSSGQLT